MAKKRNYLGDDFSDEDITKKNNRAADDDDIDSYYTSKLPKKRNGNFRKTVFWAATGAIAVCALAVGGLITANIIDKYTPNKTVISLEEYYGMTDNSSAAVYFNGEAIDERAYEFEDCWYFTKETVDEYLNDRFYYDEGNDELIYTTPSVIITIPFDAQTYYKNNDAKKESYVIARREGSEIYIAAQFVKDRTDMIYEARINPGRMLVATEYGTKACVSFSDDAAIRTGDTIKAPILSEGGGDYDWSEISRDGDWVCVGTDDGQVGYVKPKEITGEYNVTTSNSFQAPIYTSVIKPYKINLVWDAIYSMDDNDGIMNRLEGTEGVTTVSPTWYQVTDSQGGFSSYASKEYVDYIHSQGMEIWPLISDFLSVDVENGWSEYELLGDTENRRNFISSIMNEIEAYGYDGINIDFEKVSSEDGDDYVQFLRELSIACRKAEVVLSVDNYVPMSHTEHYGRQAQGEAVDYVIVMGYDEHYDGSEAGSVSSIDFVRKGIERTLESVPAEKVINALPFYTRMWMETKDESGNMVESTKAYSMIKSWQFVEDNNLEAEWDDETKQYKVAGQIDGMRFWMWLEDDHSIEEKMKAVQEYRIGGVAAWSLGLELDSVWPIINGYNHE